MDAADRDKVVEAIARALSPLCHVQAAFLFGSRAVGRAREDSDIDVAVLLAGGVADEEPRTRLRTLLEALAAELAADRLDLVILNEAPPALAFQVLKYGVLAMDRDPVPLHRFRVRVYSEHADFEPVERFFREVTRRRALEQARRG